MPPLPAAPDDYPRIDFRSAEFPSDALSVKRLRHLFPAGFDNEDQRPLGDICATFFYPLGADRPEHLVRLGDLITNERIVAFGALLRALYPDSRVRPFDKEDHQAVALAKRRLEESYQYFKLADSPESARLLIQQVEDQGTQQARRFNNRSR